LSEIDIGETIKNNIDYWKNLYFEEREKRNDVEEKLKITVAIITRGMYPEQNEGDNDFDRQFVLIRKDKIKKFIDEELPGEEICKSCDIYDVNGISIKEKLEKILAES
jgi:hypothetical protein